MFNILNQAEKKKKQHKPRSNDCRFYKVAFFKSGLCSGSEWSKELVPASGGDDSVQAPAPHLPAPSFLPEWPLSAPALSILGRQLPPSLHHFFHSRPVSMATDRLKDELQSGSGEAARLEVRSPGGGVCP